MLCSFNCVYLMLVLSESILHRPPMLRVCGEESSMVCGDGFRSWFEIWEFWVELVASPLNVEQGKMSIRSSRYVWSNLIFSCFSVDKLLFLVVIDSCCMVRGEVHNCGASWDERF